jgi:F0F1-type ATP synthase membrane subunit b/b'
MNTNKDVIELWGREFNIVKNGLSEAQVVSFVNELVKDHDLLMQRQEHLSALTKLAERTVTEAGKVAEEIKQEAMGQARVEAARIVVDAEEKAKTEAAKIVAAAEVQAQQVSKEKEAQVMAAATEQAEAIKSGAERLAEEIRREAEVNARIEASRIITEAEAKGQQIIKEKESEAIALANEQAKVIRSKAEQEAKALIDREIKKLQPELNHFVNRLHSQVISQLETLKSQAGELSSEVEYNTLKPTEDVESKVTKGDKERDEFLELVENTDQSNLTEPEWELEVLPPIDIMKIMGIVAYLDSLSEVKKTEIIPRNERTSIVVFLHEPLHLLEVLKGVPEVAQAEEMASSAESNGTTRKISVILSGKNGSGETDHVVSQAAKILTSESHFPPHN